MTANNLINPATQHPTDAATGLTLPLRKSLGSQALAQHRAMVAFELEVLAKKTDRFGWERDRGTPAHDRLMMDWMDTLQDFPLTEVQAACKAAVIANPKSTPNEGHVFAQIMAARAAQVAATKRHAMPPPDLARKLLSVEERRLIALRAGLPDLSGLAKEFPKSGEVSS